MTGYASTSCSAAGWVVHVEARSVNHRGLDARLTLPRACAALEPEILGMIRETMQRGRVEVRVEVVAEDRSAAAAPARIDALRFANICRELRQLGAENQLLSQPGELKMSDVLVFRKHFEAAETAEVATIDPQNPALRQAVAAALAQLVEARRAEGLGIARDLQAHLELLAEHLETLESILPAELDALRQRLSTRLGDALAEFGAGELGEERLAAELVYYADKADICEELQRAQSHLARIQEILAAPSHPEDAPNALQEPCGKALDFYLQELIRETNTMGSKSSSARATDLVIAMKSTIERMREQAANIE